MTCASCMYYRGQGAFGSCQRYPEPINKSASGWCGEFKSKEAALLSVPVLTEEDVVAEAKRRGRPRKEETNAEANG